MHFVIQQAKAYVSESTWIDELMPFLIFKNLFTVLGIMKMVI